MKKLTFAILLLASTAFAQLQNGMHPAWRAYLSTNETVSLGSTQTNISHTAVTNLTSRLEQFADTNIVDAALVQGDLGVENLYATNSYFLKTNGLAYFDAAGRLQRSNTVAGTNISIEAGAFSGNLTASATNVQKLAEAVDELVVGGGGAARSTILFGVQPDLGSSATEAVYLGGTFAGTSPAAAYAQVPLTGAYLTNVTIIRNEGSAANWDTNFVQLFFATNTTALAASNALSVWIPGGNTAFEFKQLNSGSQFVSLAGVTNITMYLKTTNNPTQMRFQGSFQIVH